LPALNFSVFYEKVKQGRKHQTVRRLRKHPIRQGDRLFLYWHLRQKDCEKLGEAVCFQEFLLRFTSTRLLVSDGLPWSLYHELPKLEVERLAWGDGFRDYKSMRRWFAGKYRNLYEEVFQVIRW